MTLCTWESPDHAKLRHKPLVPRFGVQAYTQNWPSYQQQLSHNPWCIYHTQQKLLMPATPFQIWKYLTCYIQHSFDPSYCKATAAEMMSNTLVITEILLVWSNVFFKSLAFLTFLSHSQGLWHSRILKKSWSQPPPMPVCRGPCSPTQRILKLKPCVTDLLTSWSGRLSKPTWPPRERFLFSSF